ncbi:MAG TPA: aldo/keto reductase [Polyangiaceae bacterium]|nr:aldo/keto reductase [Polyangiaceae bacterium]
MEYRRLGASGAKVSPLCLGTMTFGEADENSFMHQVGCDEATAFRIMNRALDAGVNFFDTADVYGQDGLSERVLGKFFETSGRRDEVVLATKFRFVMGSGPNRSGASRLRILKTVEASLKRLKTDRIDLYQIHMQDIDTPEEETLRALDDLVRRGLVVYIGASNYTGYRLAESLMTSELRKLTRFVTLQAQYSLSVRDLEREGVPACARFGLGILPWSPLGAGFLSGKYGRNQPPPPGARLEKWKERFASFDNERNWRILDAVNAVAAETSSTPSRVALAWLLRKPQVTSVIFGARSLEQLEDNLKAADLSLSDAQMTALDGASAFDLGYPYEFIRRIQGRW